MTSQYKCDLYYSISGDPFEIHERNEDTIEHTQTILNIYTKEDEEVPGKTAIQKLKTATTELSLPHPIQKGQFFNSESCCMLFNEDGELLKINGEHLFKITMLRDAVDTEKLHVKFEKIIFEGRHEWHSVEVPHA
jgi:hypothetical protein